VQIILFYPGNKQEEHSDGKASRQRDSKTTGRQNRKTAKNILAIATAYRQNVETLGRADGETPEQRDSKTTGHQK